MGTNRYRCNHTPHKVYSLFLLLYYNPRGNKTGLTFRCRTVRNGVSVVKKRFLPKPQSLESSRSQSVVVAAVLRVNRFPFPLGSDKALVVLEPQRVRYCFEVWGICHDSTPNSSAE